MPRKINAHGLKIVKHGEGLYLTAYWCPAGVLTIGYGHTGPDVHVGQIITGETALELLARDMADAEGDVERLVRAGVNSDQFSALVSFVFNVGGAAFGKSTLLRYLNNGQYREAADQFPRWNKGGGRVLPGLVKRRAAERALFLNEDWEKFLT